MIRAEGQFFKVIEVLGKAESKAVDTLVEDGWDIVGISLSNRSYPVLVLQDNAFDDDCEDCEENEI